MIKLIKRVWKELQKEKEAIEAQRRLVSMPIDYLAIQTIVDSISNNPDKVVVEIKTQFGYVITFRKEEVKDRKVKSFREQFENIHGNV